MKQLYRELAKRFHPDLARTDAERRTREGTMRRVNDAFREQDEAALRAISQEAEVADAAFEARSIGEKLAWAIREVARLDGLIDDLLRKLEAVRASETFRLWQRQEAGEQVIGTLETDLTNEIAGERDRLAVLIATYRQLVERRAT